MTSLVPLIVLIVWGQRALVARSSQQCKGRKGKNTLYGIDMTEVSECELIYQKY